MSNREKMERMDQILQSSSVYNNPDVLKKKSSSKKQKNEKKLANDKNIENLTVNDENIESLDFVKDTEIESLAQEDEEILTSVENTVNEEILSDDVDVEKLEKEKETENIENLEEDKNIESLDINKKNEVIEDLEQKEDVDVLSDDTNVENLDSTVVESLEEEKNRENIESLDINENNEVIEDLEQEEVDVLSDDTNVENLDSTVVESLEEEKNRENIENLDINKNSEVIEDLEDDKTKEESIEEKKSNNENSDTKKVNTVKNNEIIREIPKIETENLNTINIEDNNNKKINEEKFKKSSKIYFGFFSRVFTTLILMIVFLALLITTTKKALFVSEGKTANYKEKSQLDYKICLKENSFYEDKCLNKDMKYVANLIDKIPIDFNYYFKIDRKATLDFKYRIVGELIIADEQEKDVYFRKKYVLLNDKIDSIKDTSEYNLKENLVIDYPYYNKLANDFKATYGLDTNSYLKVNLEVQKENKDPNSEVEIQKNNDMAITIPLSEKAVNVKMNYKNINDVKQTIVKPKLQVSNTKYTVIAVIIFIILIFIIIKLGKLLSLIETKKTKYDKILNKILNEYDRLIVETETPPNLNINNIVKIKKFEELLDVRDNLKLPIMYFNVTKHQKSYFFINSNNLIYLLVLKDVDLV